MNIDQELKTLAAEVAKQGYYAEINLSWMADGWILDIGNANEFNILGPQKGAIATKGKTIEQAIERAKVIMNVHDRVDNVVAISERH